MTNCLVNKYGEKFTCCPLTENLCEICSNVCCVPSGTQCNTSNCTPKDSNAKTCDCMAWFPAIIVCPIETLICPIRCCKHKICPSNPSNYNTSNNDIISEQPKKIKNQPQ